MRLFGGLFWGVFLLTSGLVILLNLVFKLQVSSGKLIFGLFVVLIGVSLLTSNFGWDNINSTNSNTIAFSSGQQARVEDGGDYFVVFGSANYDLTDLEPGSHVSIHCAFASCGVKLPAGAVQVAANSAFGNIHFPDNSNVSFGDYNYSHPGDNAVQVEVSNAFGGVTVSN